MVRGKYQETWVENIPWRSPLWIWKLENVICLKGLNDIVEYDLCRRIIELLGKLKRYLYCSGSYPGQGQWCHDVISERARTSRSPVANFRSSIESWKLGGCDPRSIHSLCFLPFLTFLTSPVTCIGNTDLDLQHLHCTREHTLRLW